MSPETGLQITPKGEKYLAKLRSRGWTGGGLSVEEKIDWDILSDLENHMHTSSKLLSISDLITSGKDSALGRRLESSEMREVNSEKWVVEELTKLIKDGCVKAVRVKKEVAS